MDRREREGERREKETDTYVDEQIRFGSQAIDVYCFDEINKSRQHYSIQYHA